MLRNAPKALTTLVGAQVRQPTGMRLMSGLDGLRGFSEKEKAMEDMYFTQEDKRLMAKLLKKVRGPPHAGRATPSTPAHKSRGGGAARLE